MQDGNRTLPPSSAPGLAGSQHSQPDHPRPDQDQGAPTQRSRQKKANKKEGNGYDGIRGLIEGILALVPPEKKAVAQGLATEVAAVVNQQQIQKPEGQEAITIADLHKAVAEAITASGIQKTVAKAVQAAVKATAIVSNPSACT